MGVIEWNKTKWTFLNCTLTSNIFSSGHNSPGDVRDTKFVAAEKPNLEIKWGELMMMMLMYGPSTWYSELGLRLVKICLNSTALFMDYNTACTWWLVDDDDVTSVIMWWLLVRAVQPACPILGVTLLYSMVVLSTWARLYTRQMISMVDIVDWGWSSNSTLAKMKIESKSNVVYWLL